MGNSFIHYTGNGHFEITTNHVMYAISIVGLTSQITYTTNTGWEASGEGTSDGKYNYIFRYKPSGTKTAAQFTNKLVFTTTSGSIPTETVIHWTSDPDNFYGDAVEGNENSSTPFNGGTQETTTDYSIEYSSIDAGSGSGDPHIVPLFNPNTITYILPTDDKVYKYFDNMNPDFRVVINAKMWILSSRFIYMTEQLKKKNPELYELALTQVTSQYHEKMNYFSTSFARYVCIMIKTKYTYEELIVDLKTHNIVTASSLETFDQEVNSFKLKDKQTKPKFKFMNVSDVVDHDMTHENTDYNTTARIITIVLPNSNLMTIQLLRKKAPNHRNDVKILFSKVMDIKNSKACGSLIHINTTQTVPSLNHINASLEVYKHPTKIMNLRHYKYLRGQSIKKEKRFYRKNKEKNKKDDIWQLVKDDPEEAYKRWMKGDKELINIPNEILKDIDEIWEN